MITTTINYDVAANFTFDTSKVEIAASKAQLTRQTTADTFNEDFANDTGFTYSASETEFTGGLMRQKDQTPTDSVIAATFGSDTDADWHKSGSVTATEDGSPVITSGKLDCTGNVDNGVSYNITHDGTAAIKFKYTPNYTGNPPNNVDIIGIRESGGNANRILLTHSPSGDTWRIWLNNSSGTAIYTATTIGSSGVGLVSGTEYEMELNWDKDAGTVRLFQDGVLYGTLSPGAWAFTANAALLCMGGRVNAYNKADGSFDDVVFFSSVQHTTGYTPGYTLPTNVYETDEVQLPEFSRTGDGDIDSITSLTTTEVGSPRYNIKLGTGSFQYWTGSAWATSDGTYSQSNTKADFNANIATITIPAATNNVTIGVAWQAETGASPSLSSVDDLTLNHSGDYLYDQTDPAIEVAVGTAVDGISAFSAASSASGSDTVTWVIDDNGTDKYWDGAAWSASDCSVAQSNTAAVVNTNIGSLDLSSGSTIKWKAILHSDDGTTTPDVTSLTFTYDFFVVKPTAIQECIIYGWECDELQAPIEGATVKVEITQPFFHGNIRVPAVVRETTTDSTGYWELQLIETATISKHVTITIEVDTGKNSIVRTSYPITVPNQNSEALANLIT